MGIIDELERLTKEYGGLYGLNHSLRLLKIIETINEGCMYDREIVHIAVLMHDWGAYDAWKIPGVDHAVRSAQVAKAYLQDKMKDLARIEHIAECIINHHNGSKEKSIEAQLISDADGIDFLGAIGIAREFSTKPRELRKAYESAIARMEKVKQNICLDVTRQIVEERSTYMSAYLNRLAEETMDIL